jgi:hypothetical protein
VSITRGENGATLPRSLATIRDVRREMAAIYREAKGGRIDPQLLGRLVHTLNSLVALDRDHTFEQRIAALEAALAGHGAAPPKPTGSAAREARP